MTGRHWRALIGCGLMVLALAAIVLHIGSPPDSCGPNWFERYGLPAGVFIGGYNLFQRGALAEIAIAWRGRKP